jgi:orotidine-5'-phosphate decarboxylase
VIDTLPKFLLANAAVATSSDSAYIEHILNEFCEIFVSAIAGRVAAAKPNIAFFEQYGLAGLQAFHRLCSSLRAQGIAVIIDAKRGDIGSTAAAYSSAFLGRVSLQGRNVVAFEGDAVTVNPFLGFDTLEPFMRDCQEYGKGIFILVQTSNPGSKDLQGLQSGADTVSQHVARWIGRNAERLLGSSGWSSLGAVVGALYPEEARQLRQVMPRNLFLIPGLGAQGADAKDSVAGFATRNGIKGGALINASRGLLEGSGASQSGEQLVALIQGNVTRFNEQIAAALQ